MDSNLSGHDPQQPPLLATDANLELSRSVVESAPGSGSSSSEKELKRRRVEGSNKSSDEMATDDVGGSGNEKDEENDGEDEDEEEWSPVIAKPLVFYPPDEEGQQKFKRFLEQVAESEGFDFDEFPPVDCIEIGVSPCNLEPGSRWRPHIDACVAHVIRQLHAAEDLVLKLVAGEVVRANRTACMGNVFYITFKATNLLCADPNHAEKVYQAEVYKDCYGRCETQLFREKGQKDAIILHPDRAEGFMKSADDVGDGACDGE